MKKLLSSKWLWLTAVVLCAAILVHLLVVPLLVDHDGLRARLGTPLGELTEEYTPEQAAADDCLVVNCDNITAGSARWNWFRFKVALRIPAAIRICEFFSSGEQSFIDLTYTGREFAMHYPGRPATYARYLKFKKAGETRNRLFDEYDKYYLTTTADASWDDVVSSWLSSKGPESYKAYCLFLVEP